MLFVQQGVDFTHQLGQVSLYYVPHQVIIHISIPVNQNVAEGDNSPEVGNSAGRAFINSCQLIHGFIDNLKLTFYCGTQQFTLPVFGQCLATSEPMHQLGRSLNVRQVFPGLKPYKSGSLCLQRIVGKRGF